MKKNIIIALGIIGTNIFFILVLIEIVLPRMAHKRRVQYLDEFEELINRTVDREKLQEWADPALKGLKSEKVLENTCPLFFSKVMDNGHLPWVTEMETKSGDTCVDIWWRKSYGFCGIVIGQTNKYLLIKQEDWVTRYLSTNMLIYVAR